MKRLVLGAMALFCPLFAASARASDVPAAIDDQKAQKDATTLGNVTVTARQREEDLQKVPMAVSAVSGEWLDRSYTVNTQQLSQLVPSLYYNSANPRNTAYTIRGLGSNTLSVSAANDGIEPGVGFYVDGVYPDVRPPPHSISPTSTASKCFAGRRAPCSARTRQPEPSTSPAAHPRSRPKVAVKFPTATRVSCRQKARCPAR
jgi:hypothetical protein